MKILYKPNQYSQQRQRQKPVEIYPVIMAMEATYLRDKGYDVHWDEEDDGTYDEVVTQPKGIDFLSLPIPDRIFTDAFYPGYQVYGNYKYTPATHMQVADGCWHGECAFCVENKKDYKVRNVFNCLKEISSCIKLGFKEIFDDSGTFPTGNFLNTFCHILKKQDMIKIGCNMRIGADVDFRAMKLAGFRMVLFGVESANQYTLDKIKKGIKADEIEPTIKEASDAGLEPHIAVMLGFPWESAEEEAKTIELVHRLLRKGYAKTAQASIYDIPGRPRLDRGNVRKIYDVWRYPDFWFNKFKDIKSMADIKYLIKSIKKGLER